MISNEGSLRRNRDQGSSLDLDMVTISVKPVYI